MAISTIKRVAAEILRIGECKVRIKPGEVKKAEEALTRDDVRSLIKEGVVYSALRRGISRARGRAHDAQKKKGRQKGRGSTKGHKNIKKSQWMKKVRSQRTLLGKEYTDGKLSSMDRKKLYYMIKGGHFKSKNALTLYIAEHGMQKK